MKIEAQILKINNSNYTKWTAKKIKCKEKISNVTKEKNYKIAGKHKKR